MKSVSYNKEFEFLLFTDDDTRIEHPDNVKIIPFNLEELKERIHKSIIKNPNLNKPYRICDFRPMFGKIFYKELQLYDFWGYCDLDIVFGKLSKFITEKQLENYDAIFNGGHFSLIRNTFEMNHLYEKAGGLFDYKTVAKKDAIFAFDEITGIQRISQKNNMRALYHIPYIESEVKYSQLRSMLDCTNPKNQAFYWEKGELFRVKKKEEETLYQKIAYIHLQKRKLDIDQSGGKIEDSFWIKPTGFERKEYYGVPRDKDIIDKNPYNESYLRESSHYRKNKVCSILRRKPYQIYVRVKQQIGGINREHGKMKEYVWEKF